MSYERALRTINLEPTDKIGWFELIEDPRIIQKLTGMDPYADPPRVFAEAYRRLDVDVIYPHTLPETLDQADESWGLGSLKPLTHFAFKDTRDVLAYDPWDWVRSGRICGKPLDPVSPHLVEDLAEQFHARWQAKQDLMGDAAIVPGNYGFTLFHFLANTFGFQLACVAALEEPVEFKRLLDTFAQVSRAAFQAWSLLPIDLMISHDDLAMQTGTVFRPDWYRENIIPWYPELWQPLKDKGIKILFWSDGDYSAILDDVVACGADGFMVEPMISLQDVASRYQGEKFIVGNVDTGILTRGGVVDIEAEVTRCIDAAGKIPGYFLCATGSLTSTMPLANAEAYLGLVSRQRSRQSA